MTVGTFINLTGETMPLKEFAIKSLSGTRFGLSNFQLIFFGQTGDPMAVKDDETMKTFCKDAYDALGESNLTFGYYRTTGWFLADDSGRTYPMDDYPIAPGRGFIALNSGHADGVEVTFSGQVSKIDNDHTVPDGTYMLIGNSMPTDIALKDITIESLSGTRFGLSNFQLIFFGQTGDPMAVKDDEQMKTFCPEAYAALGESNLTFGYYRTTGWFLADDSGRTYPMDNYVVKGGRGFIALNSGHADGVKVTVPSPLQDAEAAK